MALFKGLSARLGRAVPGQGIIFASYEVFSQGINKTLLSLSNQSDEFVFFVQPQVPSDFHVFEPCAEVEEHGCLRRHSTRETPSRGALR